MDNGNSAKPYVFKILNRIKVDMETRSIQKMIKATQHLGGVRELKVGIMQMSKMCK